MSLFFPRRRSADLGPFVPAPGSAELAYGGDRSLRVSAAWAARRLRADLVSTLPRDVFRRLPDGRAAEVAKPPLFQRPSSLFSWSEWMYASQMDLDTHGNAFGIVTSWGSDQLPRQVELMSAADWSVRSVNGVPEYRHRGQLVPTREVWHERQYVVPGMVVGLSPVAYAAMSLDHNLSAQEFALSWFKSGAAPSGVLRNRDRELTADVAKVMKDRFRVATQRREPFVAGSDWEWTAADASGSDAKFLDAMGATTVDIARFFGVPADLIDGAVSGQSVTYANITERMLNFLVVNLGPAVARREAVLTDRALSSPRFAKLNVKALLRMDPKSEVEQLGMGIKSRIMTPDEARAILDREPLSEADYQQFDRLFARAGAEPQRSLDA